MTDCPCCSRKLLRQIRSDQVSWFCPHCWIEVPSVKPDLFLTQAKYPRQQTVHHALVFPGTHLHRSQQLSFTS